MCRAMCSARTSITSASPITTRSIASSNSSGKRDMCTPFCDAARSTVQSISAATTCSHRPQRRWMAFATPCTPARERPSWTSGSEAWRSRVTSFCSPSMSEAQDTSFARLVSLAAHDLRTPLATVFGFARTIERSADLEPPLSRYVAMIVEASMQMTELLEKVALVARIEGDRYEPVLVEVDTLALARAAVPDAQGRGATVLTDPPTVERSLGAFAECARKHGGVPAVVLRVEGPELTLAPVTPAAAPVILGDELKDLGAAVGLRAVRALGGSVAVEGDELRIRLA